MKAAAGPGAAAPRFWTVFFLVLRAARRRATGRHRRQLRLGQQRGRGRASVVWSWLGPIIGCVFVAFIHGGAALYMASAVSTAERVQAEVKGRVVVENWFAGRTEEHEAAVAKDSTLRAEISQSEDDDIKIEAPRLASRLSDDTRAVAARLHATVQHDPKLLLSLDSLWWQPGGLPELVGLFILTWWSLMLVCQGEGPELDIQRPRYPMWEWLFSHPVPPSAVFLAEMVAPIAANPLYLTAPIFPGILFGLIYGWLGGVAAAVLVGIPVALALACVGKALEIRIVLRLSPRARGAVLGLMSWFGYLSMLLLVLQATPQQTIVATMTRRLAPLGDWPLPPVRALLGFTPDGNFVYWRGALLCWLMAAVLIAAAVAFSVASTRRGLVGQSWSHGTRRPAAAARLGASPLRRKELLWLRRDGRALVQAILVPLSLAALQAFNLRNMVTSPAAAWSNLCGIAILFGTYFLLVIGPQSLASEGQALWIALTWPHGLESLLRAKARLWAAFASIVVYVILAFAAWSFPGSTIQIVLVGGAWWVFARSLAAKAVTLATVPASSGEPQKPPSGVRYAATLGALTFAIGIFTRQWGLAVAGVVYSTVTAAAMWQNFRARLPYLFDPWSETLPTPPTLLHAMVAISAMIEAVSVLSAIMVALLGRSHLIVINAALYGLCAIVTALLVTRFLDGRGVAQRDIWLWRDAQAGEPRRFRELDRPGQLRVVAIIACAAALGVLLGLMAQLYLAGLHWFPDAARLIDEGQRRLNALPNARLAYGVMAVLFAPLAEEYLFRGLLYRALDREWGGWRAVLGAAAFFAVYHPVLSWAPVAALGVLNAILFKRTGRLAPAVAAHAAYNAVVLAF